MGQQVAATLRATVGTGYTVIGDVSLKNGKTKSEIVEQIKVAVRTLAGSSTLNGFSISERAHENAFWVVTYDTGTQWTAPSQNANILNVKGATLDPTTLPAEGSLVFDLDQMRATEGLRFEARVASGTAEVEIAVGSDS